MAVENQKKSDLPQTSIEVVKPETEKLKLKPEDTPVSRNQMIINVVCYLQIYTPNTFQNYIYLIYIFLYIPI